MSSGNHARLDLKVGTAVACSRVTRLPDERSLDSASVAVNMTKGTELAVTVVRLGTGTHLSPKRKPTRITHSSASRLIFALDPATTTPVNYRSNGRRAERTTPNTKGRS